MCVCVFIACCFCCLSPPSPWKSQQERKRRTFIVMTEVYRKLLVPSSCSIQSVLYVSECEGGFKWSISSRLPPSERTTKRMVVRSSKSVEFIILCGRKSSCEKLLLCGVYGVFSAPFRIELRPAGKQIKAKIPPRLPPKMDMEEMRFISF